MKIKYKIETYLTRFEGKVSFNCYEMFDVTSETYLDVSNCLHVNVIANLRLFPYGCLCYLWTYLYALEISRATD